MKDNNPAISGPMGKEPPTAASVLDGHAPALTEARLRALLAKNCQ